MFRRGFISRLTLASASGLGAISGASSNGRTHKVTFRVSGFTCITCAAGLDSLLSKEDGVVESKSSYCDGITTVEFRPELISEHSLKASISEMGFSATEVHKQGK